jgi:methionine aminopeptidase
VAKSSRKATRRKVTLAEIRRAVADYMASEGCSCCGNYDQHAIDKLALGKLLHAKMYADKSGYDFRICDVELNRRSTTERIREFYDNL